MKVEPYLFFEGRCEEAMEFYKSAIGAEVTFMMRYKESPEPPKPGMTPPNSENKIMHGNMRIGDSMVMASDGNCSGKPKFDGFSLSIVAGTDAEADKKFNALANGGQVAMPLTKTFFSSKFGMLKDRFGVHWMIMVQK
jgi:PhnB protein